MYDLVSDPGEQRDAAASHVDAAARLMRAIEDHVIAASQGRPVPTLTTITPAQAEQVRALGYTE